MKPRYGIRTKLLIWFFAFALIFYGTVYVLYAAVEKIVNISEEIVNKNFEVSSISKRMIENLLGMDENEKKYFLFQKKDYLEYFLSARRAFDRDLGRILAIGESTPIAKEWQKLAQNYRAYFSKAEGARGEGAPAFTKIPEPVINGWIDMVTRAQAANQEKVESTARELNRRSHRAARAGLIGIIVTIFVGLTGLVYLSYSMILPIQELLRGIHAVSADKAGDPIRIRSRDELGELARAFNEMMAELKEQERFRSDFISTLSHEIRTPLTSIRESVNMVAEEVMGPINNRQRKFLEIAGTEIGRICGLLNHLMQVSRLEAGIRNIRLQPVDAYSLLIESIQNMKPSAEAKNIDMRIDIDASIPKVLSDPGHLQQIFHNLVGNAIKFSPSGSDILIGARLDDGCRSIRFSISDKGPGIPEDEQALIFKKYYRGRVTRENMEGAGLGLSISREIVRAQGGDIWVESKIGEGSTFVFTLPVVRGA